MVKWLYTAVIRSRVSYGFLVWWPAVKKSSAKTSLFSDNWRNKDDTEYRIKRASEPSCASSVDEGMMS